MSAYSRNITQTARNIAFDKLSNSINIEPSELMRGFVGFANSLQPKELVNAGLIDNIASFIEAYES